MCQKECQTNDAVENSSKKLLEHMVENNLSYNETQKLFEIAGQGAAELHDQVGVAKEEIKISIIGRLIF